MLFRLLALISFALANPLLAGGRRVLTGVANAGGRLGTRGMSTSLEMAMVRNGKIPPSMVPNNLNSRFVLQHGRLPSHMLPTDLGTRYVMQNGRLPANLLPTDLASRYVLKHGALPADLAQLTLKQRLNLFDTTGQILKNMNVQQRLNFFDTNAQILKDLGLQRRFMNLHLEDALKEWRLHEFFKGA